ncbi:MAG: TonB-dependent receptor [Thermoanaerobaculia bacterium]
MDLARTDAFGRLPRRLVGVALLVGLTVPALPAWAQDTDDEMDDTPRVEEKIQVTATRLPEPADPVPAAVTVVTGEELEAIGADDLPSALSTVAGTLAVPGGDLGPAGSVVEMWGLREFDAFLLVVDGVPWGGAFNPALATLDMHNIERIEIERGAAPVMYGATSFIGVIHVIHRDAGEGDLFARIAGGSHSSGSAEVYVPISSGGRVNQSLGVDYETRGLEDERAGFDRAHVLYRTSSEVGGGRLRLDADVTLLDQEPMSPHPRVGTTLTPLVPIDANHNPSDSQQDEDRFHLVGGWEKDLAGDRSVGVTLAFTGVQRDVVKGFLKEVSNDDLNAAGFRQEQEETGIYFDAHMAFEPTDQVHFIVGIDHLYGKGESEAENFDYHVDLDGSNAESSRQGELLEETELEDERNFSGLYAQAEWTPTDRLRFDIGARLNYTKEEREGEAEPIGEEEDPNEEEEGGMDEAETTKASGSFGVSYRAWEGDDAALWVFGNYRSSFKPAAIDFGPEAEGIEILDPETGESVEIGLKGRSAHRRLEWMVSAFKMDFDNVVTSAIVNDRPVLVNGGEQKLEGVEGEMAIDLAPQLRLFATYAYHNARFGDFVRLFDGVPTQLEGNRPELSPQDLATLGLVWTSHGPWSARIIGESVGDRYLDKRNRALAAGYETFSAGLSYRANDWEVSLDGDNLADARDPVAESELGDAQYYRLEGRRYTLSLSRTFQ